MARFTYALRSFWIGVALSIPATALGQIDIHHLPIDPGSAASAPQTSEGAGGNSAGNSQPSNLWGGDWDRDAKDAATNAKNDPERVYEPGEVLSLNLSTKGFRAARDLGFAIAR